MQRLDPNENTNPEQDAFGEEVEQVPVEERQRRSGIDQIMQAFPVGAHAAGGPIV